MDYTTLGRTGLVVSRMGLGCGGHSRLGLSTGGSEENAIEIVREALSLGINFIDTAESYRTEEVVGRALQGLPRSRVIISTKAGVDWQDRLSTAGEMRERVEACLRRLNTDYIDVFHLHGVLQEEYTHGREELVPELQRLKQEGKIRFIGITEGFIQDTDHKMLSRAVRDDCWDVVMVGFNVLNQSARESVLYATLEKGIDTLCMFAVRRALTHPEVLIELVKDLAGRGEVDGSQFDLNDPLGFLGDVTDACYRFCRWEPGLDVILSGSGNVEHLRANAKSICAEPLAAEVTERLRKLFAGVSSVSGN